jgi:hypothetical protein
MATRQPRYSKEEFARRGQEIYDRVIRPALRPEDDGKFVAIDIETGDYEMDQDDRTAVERLLRRRSDAQTWLERVGEPAAYRLGGRFLSPAEHLSSNPDGTHSILRPARVQRAR